ncbi:MAG: hypothetical protein CMP20_01475 [Rickettsiales bacterium]|nr:hypothetical protein [Rickettsiales bacterium]
MTVKIVLGKRSVAAKRTNVLFAVCVFCVDVFFECSRRMCFECVAKLALERLLSVCFHMAFQILFATNFNVANGTFDRFSRSVNTSQMVFQITIDVKTLLVTTTVQMRTFVRTWQSSNTTVQRTSSWHKLMAKVAPFLGTATLAFRFCSMNDDLFGWHKATRVDLFVRHKLFASQVL